MRPPIYFECPFCKAQPSERCTSKSGKIYSKYECHLDRKRLARTTQVSNYDEAIALLKKALCYTKHKYTCKAVTNINNCSCGLIKLYNDFDREMTYWENEYNKI